MPISIASESVSSIPSTTSRRAGGTRILELDGLRAFAVLAVIGFHYTTGTPLETHVFRLGWAGVDLFFVLSGFLITGILLDMRSRPHYFRTFYMRRVLRIFPVYYLLLGAYFVAALRLGGAQPWGYWTMQAGFLSSSLGFFHSWNFAAPEFVYGGLIVLWSLSVEEHFYLVWAPVVRYLRPRLMTGLIAAMIVAAPALRFALHQKWVPEYYFFPARMDSLAWGALIALLLHRGGALREQLGRWLGPALGASCALLLAAIVLTGGGARSNLAFATIGYTLLGLTFAALVAWVVVNAGSGRGACRLLRRQPWQKIGQVSYMIYMVHYPLLFLVQRALGTRLGRGALHTAVADVIALTLAIGVASLSWKYFEGPVLALKDRMAPRRTAGGFNAQAVSEPA